MRWLAISLTLLLTPFLLVQAQVPSFFSFQGELTDAAGLPVTTDTTVRFTIFWGGDATENPSTGKPVYQEDVVVSTDSAGVFQHDIGSGSATLGCDEDRDGTADELCTLAANDFPGTAIVPEIFLELRIDPDGVNNILLPRQRLVSVAFAMNAQTVVGETPSSWKDSLDSAYDQGGAGLGRTITADSGAVAVEGTDGLTVSGSVGIGTSTPQNPIHIDTTVDVPVRVTSSAGRAGLVLEGSADGLVQASEWDTTKRMSLGATSSIDDGARVTVAGRDYDLSGSSLGAGGMKFETARLASDADLLFRTQGSDRMILNHEGRLGIATTTPLSGLDVRYPSTGSTGYRGIHYGYNNDEGGVWIGSWGPTVGYYAAGMYRASGTWWAKADSASSVFMTGGEISFTANAGLTVDQAFTASERMRIRYNGNVGINTASPQYRLDVAGSVHATNHPTSSDRRFKRDIETIPDALAKVRRLRGVTFDWNSVYESMGRASGHKEIGVIAQELETVVPELVTTWGETDYRAVEYGRMSALLIEAVKELAAENAALRARLDRIETRIEDVSRRD